jgi:PAS domain S-box-containing protein
MPVKRKKPADLKKEIKSLRRRFAELQKNKLKKEELESLRKSELLYRALMENIHLGITLINKDYRIVTTNAGQGRIFKKNHHEFVGKYCFREFEKRSKVCSHCPGKKSMATGRPAEVQTEGIRDDGSRAAAYLRTFPVFEADGSISGFIEIVEDITEYKQTEESLKESEERFKAIFDNAADGILLAEVESKKLYMANKVFCRMLGYKPGEIKNLTVSDIHPEESLSYVTSQFEKQARKEITLAADIPVKRKNGSVFYADVNAFPVTLGGKTYLMGIFRDITQRRQAEEELKESEQRFKAIFDNATDGMLLMDVQSKKFHLGNKAICEMLGYKPEEIKNLSVMDIHPKELLPSVLKQFKRQAAREITIDEGVPVKRKNGSIFYADISAFPITFGGKTSITGVFRDITEHKKAEEKVRQSEDKYRMLLENLPQKIFLKDRNSVYVSCNANYADDMKIKPDEITGRTDYDFYPKSLAEKYRTDDKRVMESGKVEDIEEKYITEGQELFVHTVKTPVRDRQGNTVGLLGIFWDITKQKKIEEELNIYREKMVRAERLASLGTLSATVAHEMTQPLTVIRLSIENSLESLEPTSCCITVKDALKDALNEVKNATSVVDRFRNYARQSTRKPLCETNLGTVAGRIVQLLGKAAERAKMTLNLKGLDKLPLVYSNEKDLEQLFFALIENAIQAADNQNSHQLTIEGIVKDKNIELRFADNCSGIAPENLDKIFDPFFTTGSDDGRTGLGLAIVQRVVSEHGGKIHVRSRLGKGTTFYIILPIHSEIVE